MTPPFYVGQEVEAIYAHSQGVYNKGDRFTVECVDYRCCQPVIGIGVASTAQKGRCVCGGYYFINNSQWLFCAAHFRAITPSFSEISFSKVMEEVLVSEN